MEIVKDGQVQSEPERLVPGSEGRYTESCFPELRCLFSGRLWHSAVDPEASWRFGKCQFPLKEFAIGGATDLPRSALASSPSRTPAERRCSKS